MSTKTTTRTVSGRDMEIIRDARQLMAAMWANHYDLAAQFARDFGRGWRLAGVYGIGVACWACYYSLQHTVGGWDCAAMARNIGSMACD